MVMTESKMGYDMLENVIKLYEPITLCDNAITKGIVFTVFGDVKSKFKAMGCIMSICIIHKIQRKA